MNCKVFGMCMSDFTYTHPVINQCWDRAEAPSGQARTNFPCCSQAFIDKLDEVTLSSMLPDFTKLTPLLNQLWYIGGAVCPGRWCEAIFHATMSSCNCSMRLSFIFRRRHSYCYASITKTDLFEVFTARLFLETVVSEKCGRSKSGHCNNNNKNLDISKFLLQVENLSV